MQDPIVVTGLGAVSPLGSGVDASWTRLLAGKSGIAPNTRFDTEGWKCRIAGLVPSREDDPEGFDPTASMSPQDLRKTDLFIHVINTNPTFDSDRQISLSLHSGDTIGNQTGLSHQTGTETA